MRQMETRQASRDRALEQDSNRDRDTQKQGSGQEEERLKRGQEETGAGWEDPERANPERANEEDREGERGRRAAGAQPLPPWLPQCQAGLCIPKASPETLACWSMKARRKVAKLGGS